MFRLSLIPWRLVLNGVLLIAATLPVACVNINLTTSAPTTPPMTVEPGETATASQESYSGPSVVVLWNEAMLAAIRMRWVRR